jgi:hypothetical protein
LSESFKRTIEGTNVSTTDAVYEPLVADGELVKGGRVYRCKVATGATGDCHCYACTGNEKAPKDGTIYLQGLQIWKKVITPAANGPMPEPKSSLNTIIKNVMRKACPVSRYVSYALEVGEKWSLKAGGAGTLEASAVGFVNFGLAAEALEEI